MVVVIVFFESHYLNLCGVSIYFMFMVRLGLNKAPVITDMSLYIKSENGMG
ncbi:hypothetical protein DSUL_40070 [Desulfovibrionales bacterium]